MGEETKTLEMRIAELEDKISKFTLTDEQLAEARKVGTLGAASPTFSCVFNCFTCIVHQCIISQCIRQCIISQCIRQCFECTCGPCIQSPVGSSGGGFGSLGM